MSFKSIFNYNLNSTILQQDIKVVYKPHIELLDLDIQFHSCYYHQLVSWDHTVVAVVVEVEEACNSY